MTELSLLVKVTVVLILALAAAWLGRRQSAALRALILTCAFAGLLLLPIAALTLPVRAIEVHATDWLPFAGDPLTAVAPLTSSPDTVDSASAPSSRVWMPSMRLAVWCGAPARSSSWRRSSSASSVSGTFALRGGHGPFHPCHRRSPFCGMMNCESRLLTGFGGR